MRLIEIQRHFQATILDSRAATEARLRIHHNHFWSRMHGFVTSWHPLLAGFLGDDEIREVVYRYIAAHPPRTCVARQVSAELASFLASTEPWCDQPMIGALAAYDFARIGTTLSAEEATLSRADLDTASPSALASVVLRLKKRTALAVEHYRFHATPPWQWTRTMPREPNPTYLLFHATRRIMTTEIDRRSYLALARLAEGGTLHALFGALQQLAFEDAEIEQFIGRCLDAELLVAGGPA